MVSTLTRRSAELSLRALALGATDYIPKPETTYEAMTSAAFRRELIDKVRGLGRKRLLLREGAPPLAPEETPTPARRCGARRCLAAKLLPELKPQRAAEKGEITLRPFALTLPRALVIGSSTGGPQALTALFEKLTAAVDRAPVLITQHMPPTFTTVLAEHLRRVSGRGAREAEHGEPVLAGGIYLAPGGCHMRVVRDGDMRQNRARRRPADQFLQAVGRSFVFLGGRGVGLERARAGSHRHGLRRHAGRRRYRRRRRQCHRPGRSDQRGVGHAALGRAGRAVLGRAAARPNSGKSSSLAVGGPIVTPLDYDFLRSALKQRSGLVLSADKQYLVESRLLAGRAQGRSREPRRARRSAQSAAATTR